MRSKTALSIAAFQCSQYFLLFFLQEKIPSCFVTMPWFCWTVPLWKKPARSAGEGLTYPWLILLLLNAANYLTKLQGGIAVLGGGLLASSSFYSHPVQERLLAD